MTMTNDYNTSMLYNIILTIETLYRYTIMQLHLELDNAWAVPHPLVIGRMLLWERRFLYFHVQIIRDSSLGVGVEPYMGKL